MTLDMERRKKISDLKKIRNKPDLIIEADYSYKQIIGAKGVLSLNFLKGKHVLLLRGEIDFLFCKKKWIFV